MSLILDALKRAERERHAEPTSPLGEVARGPAPRPRRRWGRWIAVALLVGVVAFVANAVLKKRAQRPSPKAATSIPAPQARAPQPAPRPAPVPPPASEPAPAPPPAIQARPPPTVVPGTEGVASLDDLTQESDVELVPAAPAPVPQPRAEERPELTAEPQPAPEPPEETAPEAPAAAPQAQATPAEPPPREIPPALKQQAPMRKLREMPPEYRADFPALTIEVHVYEAPVAKRFVMVNGRRYHQGDRLAEGPQIVEIVRDGMILDYRGERVLFPLGR
jgi:general secretion pathway protein B